MSVRFVKNPAYHVACAPDTLRSARKFLTRNVTSGAAMAARRLNVRRHLRRVFAHCYEAYIEARAFSFSTSCAAIYDALGKGGARPPYGRVRVRATQSDYICDFEITALRTLYPDEYAYFNAVYVRNDSAIDAAIARKWPKKSYHRFVNRLEEKMGAALKARGVFPLAQYFAPRFIK